MTDLIVDKLNLLDHSLLDELQFELQVLMCEYGIIVLLDVGV